MIISPTVNLPVRSSDTAEYREKPLSEWSKEKDFPPSHTAPAILD
jgi:hypothetical protein